jgi:glycosyltransferase involved in cell wall biosynthesis
LQNSRFDTAGFDSVQAMSPSRSILLFHAGAELYGADKILHILAKGLIARHWKVIVVLPWHGELNARLEECGATVIVINHGVLRRKYFKPCGLLNRMRLMLTAAVAAARIAREHGVAVVHTNTSVVLAGALTAKLTGAAHVWHVHEITTRPKPVWRLLSWLIPRLSDRVVCVSNAVLEHLIAGNAANARKGLVLHNGIDPMVAPDMARTQIRQELAFSEDNVVIGMVGRVNNWKGQLALAEAAKSVLIAFPNARFLFVGGTFAGDEHLMTELRQRTSAGALAGKATVLPYRNDVASILAAIDIFVLPSTQPDPLPTVVLEAMSSGKPIVGFAHGGICEMVVEQETGLLVPPCDTAALAKAIETLVADSQLRRMYGDAGQRRFQQSFTVNAFLNKFEAVYEEVINR